MNEELLKKIKERQPHEAVLFIAGNQEMIRLCVAWRNIQVVSSKIESTDLIDDKDIWDKLWDNVRFDKEKLFEIANIPFYRAEVLLPFLIGNYLIYPDGTINIYIDKYLKKLALSHFRS